MTTYGFTYYDGNSGITEEYSKVSDAIDAAEIKWDHLTKNEKRRYTDRSQGAYFMVCEMDGEEFGICVKDFAEEVE